MAVVHKLEDFTWKLTKLMPENKMAPTGALCLKVKVKGLGEVGMLVKSNCTLEQYQQTAKLLRMDLHKKTNAPLDHVPEFIQKIEAIQKLSKWKKFLKFIKKIFKP